MEVDSLNRMSAQLQSAIQKKPISISTEEGSYSVEQQGVSQSIQHAKLIQNNKHIQNGKPLDKDKDENNGEEITTLDSNITEEFLKKTIDRVNKELIGAHTRFSYNLHEKTGMYVIKVINSDTKEIIREIPPEKTLDAVAKMWELAGIFVDERK